VEHLFIEDIDFKNSSYLVLLESMVFLKKRLATNGTDLHE
jgi:hypothetical protein